MRVRARPLEFYTFCCHKCHTSFASCWKIGDYLLFIHLLRKRRAFPSNNWGRNDKKCVVRKKKWLWCSANCVIIWESTSLVCILRKYVHVSSWTCAYFLLFWAYSSVKCSVFPLQNNVLFYYKRRVVLLQTTCYFTTNDVLFYHKRRDVLLQTTCRFTANDVLFYPKRRVVSLKMNMLLFGCCDTCDSKKTKIL